MTAAIINYQDIVPYAPIPKTISDMLSDREFRLFSRMAGLSKMGQQKVWLRQDTVAEWIACSYSTAGRTIRGIVKKGLAKFTGQWHQGRHKVYEVCPLPQKNLPKSTYATHSTT